LPETAGVVRGKPALRHYWTEALKLLPELHFIIEDVYQVVATVAITCRNEPFPGQE
jgi:hypothetical protein